MLRFLFFEDRHRNWCNLNIAAQDTGGVLANHWELQQRFADSEIERVQERKVLIERVQEELEAIRLD